MKDEEIRRIVGKPYTGTKPLFYIDDPHKDRPTKLSTLREWQIAAWVCFASLLILSFIAVWHCHWYCVELSTTRDAEWFLRRELKLVRESYLLRQETIDIQNERIKNLQDQLAMIKEAKHENIKRNPAVFVFTQSASPAASE